MARRRIFAYAALFLASDESSYTGTDILVDGALLLEFQRAKRERPRDPFWATLREYLKDFPLEAWKEKRPDWLDRKPGEAGPAPRPAAQPVAQPAAQR